MNKKHFVSLSFVDDGGRIRSITLKTKRRLVTAPVIRQALQELDMTENASLLSASWLGRMSDAEYVNGGGDKNGRQYVLWLALVTLSFTVMALVVSRLF